MIPWCFAYDNVNYARYLPAYLSEMTHLEETHPEAHEFLKSGGFSVQFGDQNPFGRVPVDQICDETVNKDTQTAGGTKGFSLKAGAVSKYYIVSEFRSIFLKQLRDMLNLSKSNSAHTDLQKTRIARDEADVKSLTAMLESNWINPFSAELQGLVCLSTGKVATQKIEEELLNAKAIGEKAYKEFRAQRLEANSPVKFHESFFYFLLNQTRIHLVFDCTCILGLIIRAPLKISCFEGLVNCLGLVAMATTGSSVAFARFIFPQLYKNSFQVIMRPKSPAPDSLSRNFQYFEARLQST